MKVNNIEKNEEINNEKYEWMSGSKQKEELHFCSEL